ncbi:MAG TPA: hypothetical protein VMY42_07745 [Thermoguttaceae bacterium]|nr:hypothetical protein [Thermoguttaceae bacterium]
MSCLFVLLAIAPIAPGSETARQNHPVPIVVSPQAGALDRRAGEELAGLLEAIYPSTPFVLAGQMPEEGNAILVGSPAGNPLLQKYLGDGKLAGRGSFVVTTAEDNGRRIGVIAGFDARATLHAVYALAERLGHGFYMSYDARPDDDEKPFDFQQWNLADAPIFGERIVFNWHNFLSSCSTWDLPEWKQWIRQAARMRYSGVMVHAYGNNPMVCFTMNGRTKPVGYLTTTAKGRDWGTQHVNDVRRLHGAEDFFDGPVFGSKAAMVPDDNRVAAAKALMKQAFAYAEEQGVDVVFALDVDTDSANPTNVIETLPDRARFYSAGRPLVDPDVPEGYAYYKVQLETLLGDYPQIDRLAVWFRSGRTPWRDLKPADFPESWKAEYEEILAAHPEIARDGGSPSMFAIGKIVRAFRKLLDEMGRDDVKLAVGSWSFWFLTPADVFMPRDVAFMPLDTAVQFESPGVQELFGKVGQHRPLIPIVWAHHDDRTYIGRPYTPFPNFASQLHQSRAAGFGIIHWTTRPLDIYFKSLAEQTWTRTRDLPLEGTCRQMAARTFGPRWRETMGEYLDRWVTEGPQFGRETSDRFIDRPLDEPEETIAAARKRLEMLEAVDAASLAPPAREQLDYFKLLERFFIEFYRNETTLRQSIELLEGGELEGARTAIESCRPEAAIELYARAAGQGEISRGEQALIVSLNLRWLPYFEAQRQAVGVAPVRINFQPTQHDPLAQGAGRRTFFVDPKGQMWLGLGEKETGYKVYGPDSRKVPPPSDAEEQVCLTCLGSDQPIRLQLRNMIGGPLANGTHKVHLLLADNLVDNPARPLFELTLRGSGRGEPVTDRIDFARHIKLGAGAVRLSYTLPIDRGSLELELKPVQGTVPLAGVVIECVEAE